MSRQIDCGLFRLHHPSLTCKQIQCQPLLHFQRPSADYSQPSSYNFSNFLRRIEFTLASTFIYALCMYLTIFYKSFLSSAPKSTRWEEESKRMLWQWPQPFLKYEDDLRARWFDFLWSPSFFFLHNSFFPSAILSVQRIPISLRKNRSFSPRIFPFLSILFVPH